MLISYGVERAREDGVPAYLEATASGMPVYQRCGFRQVGDVVPWDMRPYGIDLMFNLAKMAYFPEEFGESPDAVESQDAEESCGEA